MAFSCRLFDNDKAGGETQWLRGHGIFIEKDQKQYNNKKKKKKCDNNNLKAGEEKQKVGGHGIFNIIH